MSFSDDIQQEASLSYQEKSILVALAGSILVYTIFGVFVWQRYQAGAFDSATVFQFWGRAVLILIGAQIVLAILGQIMLNIGHAITAREEEIPTFEDERDKLIDLKATRNTFVVFGIGFILAMIALAVGQPPMWMLMIILVAIIAAEILGNVSKFFLYRRGG
jgi:uncharacterized membrane protein